MISVIGVGYKIPEYIGTAMDGLLAQTKQPNEFICVLDGPQDETADVVKRRFDAGYQIPHKLITFSENQGTASCRNEGILAAQYDHIAFLDLDDWPMPLWLQEMHLEMSNNNSQACFTNFWWLDERGKFMKATSSNGTYETLGMGCFIRPNQMVHASVFEELGGFDPAFPMAEDYDFWERYMREYKQIGFVNEPLFVYRRHPKAKVRTGYVGANKEREIIQARVRENLKDVHKGT